MLIRHDDPFLPSPIPERRRRVFGRHHIMFPGQYDANSPCCNCNTCPIVFSDDFSADNLASNYTVVDGTWSVSGGTLATSDPDAAIVANTGIPVGYTAFYYIAQINLVDTTDKGQMIFAYTDSDNYWFAECVRGSGNCTIRLYQRSSGTNTLRGTAVSSSFLDVVGYWTCQACYADGRITVAMYRGGAFGGYASYVYEATLSIVGTKCGVGTGSSSTAVEFDSLAIWKHNKDSSICPSCTYCEHCLSGIEPYQVQVEIIDVAKAGEGICQDCDLINGTYILTRSGNCCWQYTHTETESVCSSAHGWEYRKLTLTKNGNVLSLYSADLTSTCGDESGEGFPPWLRWQKDVGQSCTTWDQTELPGQWTDTGDFGWCLIGTSKAYITTL